MSFGTRLRSAREAASLSQQELADKAGVPIDSIQNWEQGRTRPRLPALGKLASALGVSLDVLVMEAADEPEGKRGQGRPGRKGKAPRPGQAPAKKGKRKQ